MPRKKHPTAGVYEISCAGMRTERKGALLARASQRTSDGGAARQRRPYSASAAFFRRCFHPLASRFHDEDQLPQNVLLVFGKGTPRGEHFPLFLRQFHHIAFGEKLGQGDAESCANALQSCDRRRGIAVEDIRHRGLRQAGRNGKPVFAPFALRHQFPNTRLRVHLPHLLNNILGFN